MSGDNSTPDYDSTWYQHNVDGKLVPAFRVQHRDNGYAAETSEKPRFGPNDTGAAMLRPVETRISQLKAQLADSSGFDPANGQPKYRYESGSRERANLERELRQLEEHTLPLTRRMAAEADAYHASQPTRTDKQRAELERQHAVRKRAQEIADEAEAQAHADRIRKSRGLSMT